jgi:hypothetical protein
LRFGLALGELVSIGYVELERKIFYVKYNLDLEILDGNLNLRSKLNSN